MNDDWLTDEKQPLGWRVLDWLMAHVIPWIFVLAVLAVVGVFVLAIVGHV